MKTTCLLIDVLHENFKREKPLLFECEVTLHQITSGQSLKNLNTGRNIHAIEMKRYYDLEMVLSFLDFRAISCMGASDGMSKMSSFNIVPDSQSLVVKIVT